MKVGNWLESYQGKSGYFLAVRIRGKRVDLINIDGNAVSILPDEPASWYASWRSIRFKSLSEVDFLPHPTHKRIIKAIFEVTR